MHEDSGLIWLDLGIAFAVGVLVGLLLSVYAKRAPASNPPTNAIE